MRFCTKKLLGKVMRASEVMVLLLKGKNIREVILKVTIQEAA